MSAELIFYADLNCPFCFAMNERLVELGISDVQWRGVEHEPELPVPWALTPEQQAELEDEVLRLEERAPEAAVLRPAHRPNSRAAIELVALVQRVAPEHAEALRTAIFRALWHEGRDISDPEVLNALVGELGIELESDPTAAERAREEAREWTRAWSGAGWNRIPVLAGADGSVLLGLSTRRAVEVFLGVGFSSETSLVCE